MRKLIIVFIFISFKLNGQVNFEKLADFPGIARDAAFAVFNEGYIYAGFGLAPGFYLLNDWWRYDTLTNVWLQLPDPPLTPRQYVRGFVLEQKLYVFGGYNETGALDEFYSFSFKTLAWQQLEQPPISARWAGLALSLGGKGYLGLGYNGNKSFNDLWMFDPVTNTWIEKEPLPALGRSKGVSIALEQSILVGAGLYEDTLGPNSLSDFYRYSPLSNSWKSLGSLLKPGGYDYFNSTGNCLVVIGGYNRVDDVDFVYDQVIQVEINKLLNSEIEITDLPFRRGGNLIKVDDESFFVLWGLDKDLNHLNAFYKLTIKKESKVTGLQVYPNPTFNKSMWLDLPQAERVQIFTLQGQVVYSAHLEAGLQVLQLPQYWQGFYILQAGTQSQKVWVK